MEEGFDKSPKLQHDYNGFDGWEGLGVLRNLVIGDEGIESICMTGVHFGLLQLLKLAFGFNEILAKSAAQKPSPAPRNCHHSLQVSDPC